MLVNPVSMNSSGRAREVGLMGAPVIGAQSCGMNIGASSIGRKEPLNTRPITSGARGAFFTESVNTRVVPRSRPRVSPNTWIKTDSPSIFRTSPSAVSPPG